MSVSGLRGAGKPNHIAFSAYLDHRMLSVGIDQIIKFDKMILNEGNGYSNITGQFFFKLYFVAMVVNKLKKKSFASKEVTQDMNITSLKCTHCSKKVANLYFQCFPS